MSGTGAARPKPRLGFLGVGWIGRHRMGAMLEAGACEAVAIADAAPEALSAALALAPAARACASLDDMLAMGLDGVVIATPSADHAAQSIRALGAGAAVFCQKPLGRSEAETRAVVEAARRADRLLDVDLSYRRAAGMERVREAVQSGALGRVFAADLVFHNAYGPDKPWFYDRALSGGGCVVDLGVHLVDLALWTLGFPEVRSADAALFARGAPLPPDPAEVEDCAFATLRLGDGAVARLACSWRLHAGQDAVIEASFYGTEGAASFRNVGGSFFDFRAELNRGTMRTTLAEPPDGWGGRAAVAWAERLAAGARFEPECETLCAVAGALDRIYGRPAAAA